MAKRTLILLLALLLMGVAQAAIEVYDFSSEENRLRFQSLGGELRCPKCENQSIVDSNSPSAYDMRQELFRLLEEGYTDQQVFEFMKARFGEFIMYRPPVRSDTWLLWFLPPVLVVAGLLLVFLLARRRSDKGKDETTADRPLSPSERQLRLQQILELERSASSTTNSKESS
ncbi:cytochrome c-type biogenesis protein [Marinospirillum alkaliphilum]|uniref:Cytochrome c-type biogenesis protein n=1 Tax=Marinospirillum alkaliphilum DSM 21637 TaxID=1122209 RepID=A0A1K1VCK8_9GAMM|nr:cytochrome c-type biogenesis protein [Marinospirillum alkaliphilum]SFX22866.1 cytochrome c-type biogenesis protein CcmH [Marinospirillum alkaliphilum DSM 21637]